MEHLRKESLARLVDELPNPWERAHLEACEECAVELDGLRRQTEALGRLPDLRPFPGDFDALEARLAAEGLIQVDSRANYPELQLPMTPRWMRRVAAVALFAVGVASGAALMARWHPSGPEIAAAPGASEASGDQGAALARVQQAERDYVAALVKYRQMTSAPDADPSAFDPARYAALEQMVRAGQAAVRQAPADPFLNGLLASALAEQEAVSRRASRGRTTAQQDGWF